jgi:hypothetical protein
MISELTEWPSAARTAAEKRAKAWDDFFAGEEERPAAERVIELAGLAEVQKAREPELLARENVVGVAAGVKMTKGRPTGTRALTVFVEEKRPRNRVPRAALIPAEIDGAPTDVLEVGPIRPLAFTARVRPALPGYSIGHHDITAGTFGCLARDIRRCCCSLEKDCGCAPSREECAGDYVVLSNNHVLANSNLASAGDVILQPGAFDGGIFPADGVATLERFEPIVFGSAGYNLVDAAVARPTFIRNLNPAIVGLALPRGVGEALVGQNVVKFGRTTQLTAGRVLAVNATVLVGPYAGGGFGLFAQQIVTTGMSAGGDSGSLLMDRRNLNAVGLLFAGSAEITIHNHIASVESALGVRPLTAPRFS